MNPSKMATLNILMCVSFNFSSTYIFFPLLVMLYVSFSVLILKKLKSIMILSINPEKTINQKDMCTSIFIAALFTVARTWEKKPKCSSAEEWVKKMWYICTIEYYSAIKRNETGSFVKMWMDLESVIQSEIRKRKLCIVY